MADTYKTKRYPHRLKSLHNEVCGENHDPEWCPALWNVFESANSLSGWRSLKREYRKFLYNNSLYPRWKGIKKLDTQYWRAMRHHSKCHLTWKNYNEDNDNDHLYEPRNKSYWDAW